MSKRIVLLLAAVTAILLLVPAVIFAQALKPQLLHTAPESTYIYLKADTIFTLVNAERSKAGVAPLMRDSRLDASAQAKADDMVKYNYFDHVRDGKHGYEYIPQGICAHSSENIGWTSGPGDNNAKAIDWWMHSKPHHDAILNPIYTYTGIAVAGDYSVEHFCTLK